VADAVQNPGDVFASYDSRSLKDLDRSGGELAASGALGGHALLARVYRTRETVAYYDRPDGENFVSFRTPTTWTGLQLQDAIDLGAHSIVAGVDHNRARAESERFTAVGVPGAPYSPNSTIASTAAFAEGRVALLDGRLVGTLGGRLDRVAFDIVETAMRDEPANRETHTVFNPSAGLRYGLADGLAVRASAGRAFVTPDAFNVAGYARSSAGDLGVNVTRGNPSLRPESSVTWDAGLVVSRPAAGLEAELTYFDTRVRDRITMESRPGAGERTPEGEVINTVSTYVNVNEATIRGLEGSLGYDLGAARGFDYSLRLFGGATRLLRAELVDAGNRSPILNVADLNVNAGVEYDDLRRLSTRLGARYVGARDDTDFSDWMNPGMVTFPEFLVVDLSADVRLGDRYRLGTRLENLTDEHYYEVRGYPRPGRSLRVQLGVAF
jgi:vitamin B12 transporter